MNEFAEQSQDLLKRMQGNVIWTTKLQMISRKTTADRQIFRTFAKFVENKMKSTVQRSKIEDNEHSSEN